MNLFLRMVWWLRHPPSPSRVRLVLVVVAACALIAGAEHLWGWPEWLRVNGRLRP
ncbi:hypothetical protein NX862_03560 [Rhodobacter sp. KR11]|uniref:hypothetical protein n=1 Tax=Rhodobacter sp. KR11 TaxID=2974588 RepID=UPI00222243B2|nr:hypothetical protein [Rhodobacter sp. KR11]MCW1917818.1 hypothetical protein [Rhodobacter sp. KR11]